MEPRLARADTVIYLDYPITLAFGVRLTAYGITTANRDPT